MLASAVVASAAIIVPIALRRFARIGVGAIVAFTPIAEE